MMNGKQGKNRGTGYGTPPAEHRWTAGRSGNPRGRPPGRSITAMLRKILDADDGAKARELAEAIIGEAIAGNAAAMRIVVDRIDGPLAHHLDIGAPGSSVKLIHADDERLLDRA